MLLDMEVSSEEEPMRSMAAAKGAAPRIDEARRVSRHGCCHGGGHGAHHGEHELKRQNALVA